MVAADLWFDPTERAAPLRDAGVDDGVLPLHADARSLPFAEGWFDAIVSIDSFVYYGTDDLYLANVARFLEPGGTLAIAGAGLMQEVEGDVPQHLAAWWEPSLWCLHSPARWRRHWQRTGLVDARVADALDDAAGSTGSLGSTPPRRTTRPRSRRSKPTRGATSATCAPSPRAANTRAPRRPSRACP